MRNIFNRAQANFFSKLIFAKIVKKVIGTEMFEKTVLKPSEYPTL